MSDYEHHGSNFFSGLVFGAIIGGGLVWFLTQTRQGEKIRKQVKEKSKDTIDNLTDLIEEIEEKGKEFKKKVKDIQEELSQKACESKGEIAEKAQQGLSKVEELQERGRKAAKKFFIRNGKSLG